MLTVPAGKVKFNDLYSFPSSPKPRPRKGSKFFPLPLYTLPDQPRKISMRGVVFFPMI